MKPQINFNHDADNLVDALDAQTNAQELTHEAIKLWLEDERDSISVLSEHLHNKLNYNTILLLATTQIKDKMRGGDSKLEALLSVLSSLSEMMEDEEQEGKEPKISLN